MVCASKIKIIVPNVIMNVITCQYNGLMENIVSIKRACTQSLESYWKIPWYYEGSIVFHRERSSYTSIVCASFCPADHLFTIIMSHILSYKCSTNNFGKYTSYVHYSRLLILILYLIWTVCN